MTTPPVIPPGRGLLAGKVVVVTAAAGTGIGSAVAGRCLAEGARVVISDRHERRLAAARDQLARAHGDRVCSQVCDVTDETQVGALVAAAVAPSLAIHPFLARVTSEEVLAELAGREAFGRAAHPWEVANVIVFLASDYASYLTGEVVSVSSQHP